MVAEEGNRPLAPAGTPRYPCAMTASRPHPRPRFVLAALTLPLLVPVIVYLVVAVTSGLSPVEALDALRVQFSGRPNLMATALLGLAPIALFTGVLRLLRRRDPEGRWLGVAGWSGLAPALVILIWANSEVWPLYMPGRSFPGFPHGLELVIGAIFFVPIALVLGGLAGALMARRSD